jgi:CDP-diacylglycerol--serine O-phosphatidyltransferase
MNGVCGFAAIHFAAAAKDDPFALWLEKPRLTYFAAAAFMIFFAMLADALDGRIARMAGSTSEFGEELDSLSDMVSFGVAPALLMLRVVESSLRGEIGPAGPAFAAMPGKLIWLIAAAYVCCCLLRLARFNVETAQDESSHMFFSGLPSPASAGVIAALVMLWGDLLPQLSGEVHHAIIETAMKTIVYALPFITLALALLMVSRVPYPHLVNQYIRGKRSFSHVVVVFFVILGLIWFLPVTLTLFFGGFASSGAVRWIWRKYIKRVEISVPVPATGSTTNDDPDDSAGR